MKLQLMLHFLFLLLVIVVGDVDTELLLAGKMIALFISKTRNETAIIILITIVTKIL